MLKVEAQICCSPRTNFVGGFEKLLKLPPCLPEVRILPIMTPILAKVTAIEKRGDQYQVIVQVSPKYRGSFNTLAFGEIKPHSGSLKEGRLDLVYYQNPGFNIGDPFRLWTLH
jgi:hypothetical protein